jgi:hypothetical protein
MSAASSRRCWGRTIVGLALALLAVVGCNGDPTTVVVDNGFPAAADAAGTMTVFKVWWVTTLFPSPVAPGASSETERTIAATDFAYALLAPGWSPGGGPPARLVALASAQPLTATPHDLLTITVDDAHFVGDCAAGSTLDAADAELIVERIFPGDFAGATYDPSTCTTTPAVADAGQGQ